MHEDFWFWWYGSNVYTAGAVISSSHQVKPVVATKTVFTPAPPPTAAVLTVDKVRLGRQTLVVSSGTQLYKLMNAAFYLTTGAFPTSLGAAYANIANWEAFDFYANDSGFSVIGYCDPTRNVKLESYEESASRWYYGSLPTTIDSDKLSLAHLGWDIVTNATQNIIPDKFDYRELVPYRYEIFDRAVPYTEVYEEGKTFTRQPAQYQHQVYHYTQYSHQRYNPATYQKQVYQPASYELSVWVPAVYKKQYWAGVAYSETQTRARSTSDVYSNVWRNASQFYAAFVAPYVNPCASGTGLRREVYSYSHVGMNGNYLIWRVDYAQWTVNRCPTGTWTDVSPMQTIQTDSPPAATASERWVLYQAGYWQPTGYIVFTDTAPANSSTEKWTQKTVSSWQWAVPSEYIVTDAPPAATTTVKWVLTTAAAWSQVGLEELQVKPADTSTERWVLTKAAYWEARENVFTDTPAANSATEQWIKTSVPTWRATAAGDDPLWERYQVSTSRWVKKCTWHSTALPTRVPDVDGYPFWRLMTSTDSRFTGSATRKIVDGGYEPWVPTSTTDTTTPAVVGLTSVGVTIHPYAIKFTDVWQEEFREAYYTVSIPVTGNYTLHGYADDHVDVWIDEYYQLGADLGGETSVDVNLTAGRHSIRLALYNNSGPCWMSVWITDPSGSVIWNTRDLTTQSAGILKNSGFSLETYTVSLKAGIIVALDSDSYVVTSTPLDAYTPKPLGAFAINGKISPKLPHFRTKTFMTSGISPTVQVVPSMSYGQVNEPPTYRVADNIPNYLVQEVYKTVPDNGTYTNAGGTTGLLISQASTTPYLKAPELYTAAVDSGNAAVGRDVSYSAISFSDKQNGGGLPLYGLMFPYYYVISKTWGLYERQHLIGENLTGKTYRQSGTRAISRKVVAGENLTGKTLTTVRAGGWRWVYAGETAQRQAVYQNALSVSAWSLGQMPSVGIDGVGIATVAKNPANFYRSDKISTTWGVNLGLASVAVVDQSVTVGAIIVAGADADGNVSLGHFHVPSATWLMPMTRIPGAPASRVLGVGIASDGTVVYLSLDTFQSAGQRQYAVVGVRWRSGTALVAPALVDGPRLLEAAPGPADHADAIAAQIIRGAVGKGAINAAFRDRVSRQLRFVRVSLTY